LKIFRNKKGVNLCIHFQLVLGIAKHPCKIEISKGTHLVQVHSLSLFLFALLKLAILRQEKYDYETLNMLFV